MENGGGGWDPDKNSMFNVSIAFKIKDTKVSLKRPVCSKFLCLPLHRLTGAYLCKSAKSLPVKEFLLRVCRPESCRANQHPFAEEMGPVSVLSWYSDAARGNNTRKACPLCVHYVRRSPTANRVMPAKHACSRLLSEYLITRNSAFER